MNNLSNSQYSKFRFKLSSRKFYDFQLSDKEIKTEDLNESLLITLSKSGESYINDITWDGAISNVSTINNFGLTGLDNGRIPYDPVLGYESTLNYQPELTDKFTLYKVFGHTQDIDYLIDNSTTTPVLLGGFYQGFYKLDGYDYQTLPNRYSEGWTLSIDLNKGDYNTIGLNTLNDYSAAKGYDTEGFFYYIGARAENKYWNQYEGEASYQGVKDGEFTIPLLPPRVLIKEMDNQFLIYGRSGGQKICTNNPTYGFGSHYAQDDNKDPNVTRNDEGTTLRYSGHTTFETFEDINPFLKYGRSNGKPISGNPGDDADVDYEYGTAMAQNDQSNENLETELNPNLDLVDNAVGFRIKKEQDEDNNFLGYSLGYRRIIGKDSCVVAPENPFMETDDFYVIEEYTKPGVLGEDWTNITMVWSTDESLECDDDPARTGELAIYVNGFLIYTFYDFKEIINKPLQEHKDKQLGVPYSISVGGGTQGLLENMTFGGQDPNDMGLTLEKCFAGTFIGGVKNFKFYETPLSYCNVKNNIDNNE